MAADPTLQLALAMGMDTMVTNMGMEVAVAALVVNMEMVALQTTQKLGAAGPHRHIHTPVDMALQVTRDISLAHADFQWCWSKISICGSFCLIHTQLPDN